MLEYAWMQKPRSQAAQHGPLVAFGLTGKTALVTGARRAIGRAIALALAAQGARLAIHHVGSDEETRDADSVVAKIGASRGKAQAFAADFTEDDAGSRLAQAVTGALGQV